MKLAVTLEALECVALTSDDAHNPLTHGDNLDYAVSTNIGGSHRELQRGSLGNWNPGDKRELERELWNGEIGDAPFVALSFHGIDLVLNDDLGSFELRATPEGKMEWWAGSGAQVEDGSNAVREIHLKGAGAQYVLRVRAEAEP